MSNEMTSMEMDLNDLLASADGKAGGAKTELSDGVYPSVIVGVTVENQKFTEPDGSVKESVGACFLYQVRDDNDKPSFIKGAIVKASLHEKATLRQILGSWFKLTDTKAIADKLVEIGIVNDGKFCWDNFIGLKPSLMVNMVASKKDATKQYPKVKSLIPAKKGSEIDVVPEGVPDFFVKDAIEFKLMDGFAIKKFDLTKKTDEVKKDAGINFDDAEESDTEFLKTLNQEMN